MKIISGFVLVAVTVVACVSKKEENGSKPSPIPLTGTWKLITGTVIEKGDTVVTDYTKKYPSLNSSTKHILLFYNRI